MEKKNIDYSEIGQERVITIADLIREIARRFWIVIIAAIIFAVLLGGYKYMKDSAAAKNTKTNITDETDTIVSSLSEEEQKEVNNVLMIQDNIDQQQEYAENSILMKIDPYNESTGTLQYFFDVEPYIDPSTKDYSSNLLNLYQSYVNNGMLVADLVESGIELDAQYLGELITCEVQSGMLLDNSSDAVVLEESVSSFNIKVVNVDEKSCKELTEKIAECVQDYHAKLNTSVGQHDLTLMDESYSQVVDRDLWTYKYDRVNSISSMQEKIETLKENLSTEQLDAIDQYSELSQEELNEDGTTDDSGTASVSISKKYVAAGALGGIILACLFIIISYVMRGTINRAEDLQYLYNMRILGKIDLKGKKNVFLSLWNKIIGRKEKELTLEEQLALLKSNLQITCEKNHIQRLLICGCDENKAGRLRETLQELKNQGVQMEYVSDLLYSPVSLSKLSECEDIVLVEEIRKSQYSDIAKEIEICMEQQAEILGAIVLEA